MGVTLTRFPLSFFQKCIFQRGSEVLDFVAFNFVTSYVKIPQVDFLLQFQYIIIFFGFSCYKKTDDVSIKHMASAFFNIPPTSNRWINNCVKLFFGYCWNYGQIDTSEKNTCKKPSFIRVKEKFSKSIGCIFLKGDTGTNNQFLIF